MRYQPWLLNCKTIINQRLKFSLIKIISIIFLFICLVACRDEVLYLDKLSTEVAITHEGALPLVKGTFNIEDFLESEDSDILVIDGDTIKIRYTLDSLVDYAVSDFADIPFQTGTNYVISPSMDIPLALLGLSVGQQLTLDTLGLSEPYAFNLDSMRLDKVILDNGEVVLDVENEFDMDVSLSITSSDIIDEFGNTFDQTVFINANDSLDQRISLANHEIMLTKAGSNEINIQLDIIPTFIISNPTGIISSEDSIIIDFSLADINDFKAVFGYFGQYSIDSSTNYTFDDIDNLKNLSGSFNVSDPRLSINYSHSFGIPIGVDLYLETHHGASSEIFDLSNQTIVAAEYGDEPLSEGAISFNKTTIPNIENLFSFPLPDSISLAGGVITNPGGEETTDTNFVLGDSKLLLDIELEIPMKFSADLGYLDTVDVSDLIDIEDGMVENIEYINLHHWFTNRFPFGFGINVILYDSINDTKFADTLVIGNNDTGFLLEPAPTDQNGDLIESQIEEMKGVISIMGNMAEFLIEDATHMIIQAKLQTYNVSTVNVYYSSSLDFRFALEYNLTYSTENEE